MANKIDHFPVAERRPTRRYPWDEWADGDVWELVRGDDFDAEADSFRNRLYPQAKRRGMQVRSAKGLKDGKEVLVIQFFHPGESSNGDGMEWEEQGEQEG